MLHLEDIKLSRGGGEGPPTMDVSRQSHSEEKPPSPLLWLFVIFESDSCIFGVVYWLEFLLLGTDDPLFGFDLDSELVISELIFVFVVFISGSAVETIF